MTLLRTLVVALVAVPLAALAHHGWSEYDQTQVLKITGTIDEASYMHPHGQIKLMTPGKVWVAVLAPPSRMDSRGLTKEMLKVGAAATVEGYASKLNKEEMRAERITVAGKTVELR